MLQLPDGFGQLAPNRWGPDPAADAVALRWANDFEDRFGPPKTAPLPRWMIDRLPPIPIETWQKVEERVYAIPWEQ